MTASRQRGFRGCASCCVAVTLLAIGAGCAPHGEPLADQTGGKLLLPLIHHVGLNVVDPQASMEWYRLVWPEAAPSTLDGKPALRSTFLDGDSEHEFFHVFNRVDQPAPGKWDFDRHRTIPQSAFWHIGTFEDITALRARFDELGITMAPMWETAHGQQVWRSGESHYRGMKTMEQIEEMDPEGVREGGFAYIIGSDGELVEVSGGPTARRGFDHVHFLHEQPWCAANWYIERLGMRPPLERNPSTNEIGEIEIPSPCEVEFGPPSFPSLEPHGTLRAPRMTVRYGNGSMSAYTRQCRFGRCGEDQPLVSSRGQVLEHVGFSIPDLDTHVERLRSEGVEILEETRPFGETRAAMIADLDGLLLHLVEQR